MRDSKRIQLGAFEGFNNDSLCICVRILAETAYKVRDGASFGKMLLWNSQGQDDVLSIKFHPPFCSGKKMRQLHGTYRELGIVAVPTVAELIKLVETHPKSYCNS